MPLTKEDIEKRLKALDADRKAHEDQINAIMGAMQDCEFWLDELAKAENQPKEGGPDGPDRTV